MRASSSLKHGKKRSDARFALLLALLLAVVAFRIVGWLITDEPDTRDAGQYVAIGVHLAREGTFGLGINDPITMYREPLTPWLIATQIKFDPRIRNVDPAQNDFERGAFARAVKQQNLMWSLLLLIGVALQSRKFIREIVGERSRLATVVPLATVLLVHVAFLEWEDVIDRSLNELPAAALLVWGALIIGNVVQSCEGGDSIGRTVLPAALGGGVVLGMLALTKAAFLYIVPTYLIVLIGLSARRTRKTEWRGLVAAGLVAMVAFGATVSPWLVRNAIVFEEAQISSRGGLGLWSRVTENAMDPAELRAAYVVSSPLPLQPIVAQALRVDVSEGADLSAFRRVDRHGHFRASEHDDQTFYRLARADRARLTAEFVKSEEIAWSFASTRADAVLAGWALDSLRADPWSTVRTAPMFLWRGTWPMISSNILPSALLGPLNVFGMMALLISPPYALLRRLPRVFALVGLPYGLVMFYTLFSHFEQRFSRPAAPTMLMLLVLLGVALWGRRPRVSTS